MLFHNNSTISVYRWDSYETSVITWLSIYIYELSDDINIINTIEWWLTIMKMITMYSWIQMHDKVTDQNWVDYIVKKVTQRVSLFRKFYEIIMYKAND